MKHASAWCFDIDKYRFVNNFPLFSTIGVTCVRMVFWTFGMIVFLCFFNFCAAFAKGEEVGVAFLSSWGA